ncbi:MAG: hypothetical protein ACE15E_07085 [Acidobacteriota bacterium]
MSCLVLMILFFAASQLRGCDLEQLARDLAGRISALPDMTGSVNLAARETGTASDAELRELRRLVAEELNKRRVKLSQEPAALNIVISFSEALRGRLLIAEVRAGETPDAVILPCPARSSLHAPRRRVSLQRSLVWRQDEPILDFALLPQSTLILSPRRISLFRNEEQGWKEQYSWDLSAVEQLPRDPRGRLLVSGAELRVYLPQHECHAALEPGNSLACEPGGAGWPIAQADASGTYLRLVPGRNYFDQLRSSKGAPPSVPPFYAAAVLAGPKAPLWAVTGLDGETRFYDSRPAEIGRTKGWGPDLASAEVPECGTWIVAITGSEAGQEALQAFQWVTGHPVAGSERLELEGVSTALWPDEGNRVRLVTRDLKSGKYAAWSVALVCAD